MQLLKLNEQVCRFFNDWRRTAERAFRIDQINGAVSMPANATVAWLVRFATLRTRSTDKAISQKRLRFGIIKLFDRPLCNHVGGTKRLPKLRAQFAIFIAVSAAVVIKNNVEACEISLVRGAHRRDQINFAASFFPGANHDCRAVGIIGTNINGTISAKSLEPNPDIGLDIFHQMAKVDRPVGVWQGAGNQQSACFHKWILETIDGIR